MSLRWVSLTCLHANVIAFFQYCAAL
uniref:Uncharacterized protein n=1 Tax=Anguilla anguilla TaxID=7936 RepID=A0A0E9QQP5_ANGAN